MSDFSKYLLFKMRQFITFDLEKSGNVDEKYINTFINKCYPYLDKAINVLLKNNNIMELSDEYIYEKMMIELKKFIDKEYDERIKKINFEINMNIEQSRIIYNMFEYDFYSLPINNLEDVAIDGIIKFTCNEGDITYNSEYMQNPKWVNVCKCCNDMLLLFDEKDYVVLSGISKLMYGNEYRFDMTIR